MVETWNAETYQGLLSDMCGVVWLNEWMVCGIHIVHSGLSLLWYCSEIKKLSIYPDCDYSQYTLRILATSSKLLLYQ